MKMKKENRLLKALGKQIDAAKRAIRRRTVSLRADLRQPPTWKRVKTICIVTALAGNIILLGISGGTRLQHAVQKRETYATMNTLLAQRGVLCGGSVYRALEHYPQAYTLRMDNDAQDTIARTFLSGNVTAWADTANTSVWTGDNGELRWTASGDVEGTVTLRTVAEPTDRSSAQKIVRDLLKKAGIATTEAQYTTTQRSTEYIVEVRQYADGTEIVGNVLTVTIAEGNNAVITGKWCIGDLQPLSLRALEQYSAEESVFRLLAAQSDVTQIISVQPAYILSDKSGGRFTTIPCWRFSADNGDYIMNILTGEVVASADISSMTEKEETPNYDEQFGLKTDIEPQTDAENTTGTTGTTGTTDTTGTTGTANTTNTTGTADTANSTEASGNSSAVQQDFSWDE